MMQDPLLLLLLSSSAVVAISFLVLSGGVYEPQICYSEDILWKGHQAPGNMDPCKVSVC